MMAFNAAARETCIVRGDETTTPLQALTLMNNVAFIESARFLAERILDPLPNEWTSLFDGHPKPIDMNQMSEKIRSRIRWAFRAVTSRQPTDAETHLLMDDLIAYLADFAANPESAKQLLDIGEKKHAKANQTNLLAAMTLVANTLLNLDESMTQN